MPEIPVNTVADVDKFQWEKDADKAQAAAFQLEEEQARQQAIKEKGKIDTSIGDQVLGQAYATNQYQDKTGQTGMVSDMQDRKIQLQKRAVAASMYSQEELVAAGYNSGKAVAKLKAELAGDSARTESYQQALDNAYAEADATGYLVDPIAAELNNQLAVAKGIESDITLPKADRDKATETIKAINNAFKEYGVSSQGQKTLAMINMEQQIAHQEFMQKMAQEANNIQMRLTSAYEDIANNLNNTDPDPEPEEPKVMEPTAGDSTMYDGVTTGPLVGQF